MSRAYIGDTPMQLAGQYVGYIYGQNLSPYNVYLSTDSNVSPTNFDSLLSPQGTFSWGGNDLLYAVTDSGVQATVNYIVNTSGSANVQQGPATDVLARNSAQPDFLVSYDITVGTAAGTYSFALTPPVYCADYAALTVRIKQTATVAAVFTDRVQVNLYQCKDDQLLAASITRRGNADWYYANDTTGTTRSYTTNVVDRYFRVEGSVVKVAGNAGTVTVEIYGQYLAVSKPYEYYGGDLNGTVSPNFNSLSFTWTGAGSFLFTHNAGTYYAALTKGVAAANPFYSVGSQIGVFAADLSLAGEEIYQRKTQAIFLPATRCRITFGGSVGSGALSLTGGNS